MNNETTQENPLTALLRPHVEAIKNDAQAGDVRARTVINLYQMYLACPADHAAATFCEETFKEWRKLKEAQNV